ncbi:MAG: hypothetical protein GY774_06205, partial [Planctomycetes bacterium]|nr:hypothetical protein [Planctomycetota bacterium]
MYFADTGQSRVADGDRAVGDSVVTGESEKGFGARSDNFVGQKRVDGAISKMVTGECPVKMLDNNVIADVKIDNDLYNEVQVVRNKNVVNSFNVVNSKVNSFDDVDMEGIDYDVSRDENVFNCEFDRASDLAKVSGTEAAKEDKAMHVSAGNSSDGAKNTQVVIDFSHNVHNSLFPPPPPNNTVTNNKVDHGSKDTFEPNIVEFSKVNKNLVANSEASGIIAIDKVTLKNMECNDHKCHTKDQGGPNLCSKHKLLESTLQDYDVVKNTGTYNFVTAKREVSHKFNVNNWEKYAEKLTDPTVLEFIKYGFPVDYAGQFIPVSANKNHASAENAPEAIEQYISTELEEGALLGPFTQPPFEWVRLNPLMTRDKLLKRESFW